MGSEMCIRDSFNSAEREVETRDPGAEYLAANLAVSETRGGDLLSGMDASSVSSNRSGTARMGRMIQSQARGEQAMLNVPSDAASSLLVDHHRLSSPKQSYSLSYYADAWSRCYSFPPAAVAAAGYSQLEQQHSAYSHAASVYQNARGWVAVFRAQVPDPGFVDP